ncbi:MAG TPA: hypothetical protein VLL97_04540 [Acidobacteriota bacterium]|nr:hypothetical protein [Acidobacteriota bacterium]
MDKQKMLKILNPILFVIAFFQCVNIILLKTGDASFMDEIHEWNGILLLALLALHIFLNWSWVKVNIFNKK